MALTNDVASLEVVAPVLIVQYVVANDMPVGNDPDVVKRTVVYDG
jgi:hypothetical protein